MQYTLIKEVWGRVLNNSMTALRTFDLDLNVFPDTSESIKPFKPLFVLEGCEELISQLAAAVRKERADEYWEVTPMQGLASGSEVQALNKRMLGYIADGAGMKIIPENPPLFEGENLTDEDMTPTPKHPAIDRLITELTGIDRVSAIMDHACPTCGDPVDIEKFKDELSKNEYRISGMCQKCQDSVFG